MASTWDKTLSTPKDQARLLLGDTGQDAAPFLLEDETYNAMLTTCAFARAVGRLARSLAARFAQEPSWYQDEGGTNVRWLDRVANWQRIASEYDPEASQSDSVGSGYQFQTSTLGMPDPQPNWSNYRTSSGKDVGLRP